MSEKRLPQLTLIRDGQTAQTQLVEVAPGQYTATAVHPADIPRYGLVRMMRQGDGSYIPVMKQYAQHARMCRELCSRIGLDGISPNTLYRLIQAGFVESKRPSPNVILVDLGSLVEHVEATRDPEFWTRDRIARFRAADVKS